MMLKGLVVAVTLGFTAQVSAGVLGDNVTIYDGEGYTGSNAGGEDGETEPGMVNSQRWDLEGFFVDGTDLSMVGGYDFFGGQEEYGQFTSGDLFISTLAEPVYGDSATRGSNGITTVDNEYNYNYVFDVDWETGDYNLYEIDANTQVSTGYYGSNEGSSPFEYVSGAVGGSLASGTLYSTTGTNTETGFSGGEHNIVGDFDLSAIYAALSEDTTFYSHFTMGCGNDNMMGSWEVAAVVPEPATFGLLTLGLAGLWASRRKISSTAKAVA